MSSRQVRISKTLSQVVRHIALEEGIEMRPDGFCVLEEVLSLRQLQQLQCTWLEVLEVVRNNDKQRFELWDDFGVTFIRCVQGHSIEMVLDDQLLQPYGLAICMRARHLHLLHHEYHEVGIDSWRGPQTKF